jgi:hypothetical protein
VSPPEVVEAVDVVSEHGVRLFMTFERVDLFDFSLERSEEAFGDGVESQQSPLRLMLHAMAWDSSALR